MRVSTDQDDDGYLPWRELGESRFQVDVFLDGNRVADAITADDVQGIVIVPAKDRDGDLIIPDGDKVMRHVRRGNVRIVIPEVNHGEE